MQNEKKQEEGVERRKDTEEIEEEKLAKKDEGKGEVEDE